MREGQEPTDQKAISGTRRAVWLGLEPEGGGILFFAADLRRAGV